MDAGRTYRFEWIDEHGRSESRALSGGAVQKEGLALRIKERGESLLVRYGAVGEGE